MLLEYFNDEVGVVGAKLVFDDDGRAGYAYLIVNDRVVADVLRYNADQDPRSTD